MFDSSQVTVTIPTSPIPRHPSTDLIENTISSIRYQLPNARIIVMCDGVRPNVEFRRKQYEEYKDRLTKRSLQGDFGNILIQENMVYAQQAKMMRAALEMITTPFVLFCEQDVVLVAMHNPRDGYKETLPEDCEIAWQDIADLLDSGGANIVRFYTWDQI